MIHSAVALNSFMHSYDRHSHLIFDVDTVSSFYSLFTENLKLCVYVRAHVRTHARD